MMIDEETMTDEEAARLLADGWKPAVVESLRARGFRPVGPDPELRVGMRFLRQAAFPHLLIQLEKCGSVAEIDTAIYEFGAQERHRWLAGKFYAFTDALKHPDTLGEIADKLKTETRTTP